jgi:hypothetical protein
VLVCVAWCWGVQMLGVSCIVWCSVTGVVIPRVSFGLCVVASCILASVLGVETVVMSVKGGPGEIIIRSFVVPVDSCSTSWLFTSRGE